MFYLHRRRRGRGEDRKDVLLSLLSFGHPQEVRHQARSMGLPHDNDTSEWVCGTCAEMEKASFRHDSRCLECEGLPFLLRDLTTLADLAMHQNKGTINAETRSSPVGFVSRSIMPPGFLLNTARTKFGTAIRISSSVGQRPIHKHVMPDLI